MVKYNFFAIYWKDNFLTVIKKEFHWLTIEQKKLSHQNIEIKFKQIKHKILSKRKHKNYTPVEIHSKKKQQQFKKT